MQTENSVDISLWVYREKIKMLFGNFRQSWILSLLVGGLLCYLAIDAGDFMLGMLWYAGFAFLIILRLCLVLRFHRAQIDLNEYEHWQQQFFIITLLTGVAWGAGAILIGSGQDAAGKVFILMLLIGVSGGAIPLLGMLQRVMLAFQLPMVIPYVVWMAPGFEGRGVALILVTALYLLTVMFAMKRLEKNVSLTLAMQYKLEQRTEQLQDANDKLEHMVLEDSLTQINNRRYFEREMEKEWKKARRNQTPLSLLMIDIDYFKLYNDTYGHAAGDECLRKVASLLSKAVHRPGDLLARIGGEEFVALLPDIDEEGALKVAQTMQQILQQAGIVHATSPVNEFVTVSIGYCVAVPEGDETWLGLFRAADNAMYKAKSKGRNHIVAGTMEKLER
jgi:diguanylate cyclase (GGDEF)-like protein